MFSFFRKKSAPAPAADVTPTPAPVVPPVPEAAAQRAGWLAKLSSGLKKTGSGIAQVFTGTRIDDALYEELESALLMADEPTTAASRSRVYSCTDNCQLDDLARLMISCTEES